MKLLSRTEEFVLLAALFLKDEAYSVQIRKRLKDVTGKTWSYGALFISLEQLVKKGFLTSSLTGPLPERGGRSKRIYAVTPSGHKALDDIKQMERKMWEAVPDTNGG
ncbi:MAG: PadR family transcriptional regulator [Candidatus Aminicenantes bacterium]|nr:MAG: PadR family transcriptional regulator [Candidatus Aminicenantes bacterium]